MQRLDRMLSDPTRASTLFWAITAVLVLLAVILALPLVKVFAQQGQHIALLQRQLTVQQALIARADSIHAERLALASAGSGTGDILTGRTDALATADLQALLSQRVQEVGAQLVSTQGLPPPTEGGGVGQGFVRIEVAVTAGADMRQLRDLLYRIEAEQPRLLIQSLDITAADGSGQWLDVSLRVAGFRAVSDGTDTSVGETGP